MRKGLWLECVINAQNGHSPVSYKPGIYTSQRYLPFTELNTADSRSISEKKDWIYLVTCTCRIAGKAWLPWQDVFGLSALTIHVKSQSQNCPCRQTFRLRVAFCCTALHRYLNLIGALFDQDGRLHCACARSPLGWPAAPSERCQKCEKKGGHGRKCPTDGEYAILYNLHSSYKEWNFFVFQITKKNKNKKQNKQNKKEVVSVGVQCNVRHSVYVFFVVVVFLAPHFALICLH